MIINSPKDKHPAEGDVELLGGVCVTFKCEIIYLLGDALVIEFLYHISDAALPSVLQLNKVPLATSVRAPSQAYKRCNMVNFSMLVQL